MARITIEELPVGEALTPEQEELLRGAGFKPSFEQLEARELMAAGLTQSLLPNLMASHNPPGAVVGQVRFGQQLSSGVGSAREMTLATAYAGTLNTSQGTLQSQVDVSKDVADSAALKSQLQDLRMDGFQQHLDDHSVNPVDQTDNERRLTEAPRGSLGSLQSEADPISQHDAPIVAEQAKSLFEQKVIKNVSNLWYGMTGVSETSYQVEGGKISVTFTVQREGNLNSTWHVTASFEREKMRGDMYHYKCIGVESNDFSLGSKTDFSNGVKASAFSTSIEVSTGWYDKSRVSEEVRQKVEQMLGGDINRAQYRITSVSAGGTDGGGLDVTFQLGRLNGHGITHFSIHLELVGHNPDTHQTTFRCTSVEGSFLGFSIQSLKGLQLTVVGGGERQLTEAPKGSPRSLLSDNQAVTQHDAPSVAEQVKSRFEQNVIKNASNLWYGMTDVSETSYQVDGDKLSVTLTVQREGQMNSTWHVTASFEREKMCGPSYFYRCTGVESSDFSLGNKTDFCNGVKALAFNTSIEARGVYDADRVVNQFFQDVQQAAGREVREHGLSFFVRGVSSYEAIDGGLRVVFDLNDATGTNQAKTMTLSLEYLGGGAGSSHFRCYSMSLYDAQGNGLDSSSSFRDYVIGRNYQVSDQARLTAVAPAPGMSATPQAEVAGRQQQTSAVPTDAQFASQKHQAAVAATDAFFTDPNLFGHDRKDEK